MLQTVLPAI
ncbi:hypothetical protein D039_2863A, partial [Vibrio parahaemolyticus EKP-028]